MKIPISTIDVKANYPLCYCFDELSTKGRSILFNHFIDMRTTVNLSISCRINVFLLKFSNKNTFFLHEIDKLTVVLMSIK